jgi:glycosyltransferase involved in cell wall biosynthesis
MNIVFLCNEYPPVMHGGIGTYTQTLGRALVRRGHCVTVVGLYPPQKAGKENDQGVEVIRMGLSPVPKTGFLIDSIRINNLIRDISNRSGVDILDGPESAFAFLNSRLPGQKILRMSGGHTFFSSTLGKKKNPWKTWIEQQSFKKAHHLCAVSKFAAEETRKLLRLGDRSIQILPNPVDPQLFKPLPEIPEIRNLLIFAGTLCEKKGIRQLIQALHSIQEQFPDVQLWAFGRDTKDPKTGQSYLQQLENWLPSSLLKFVTFKGPVEYQQLPRMNALASVLVYPSHMETQGIVVIEGMACQKTVIASELGPGPEIIRHGIDGLLCNPYDPASIAANVIQALNDAQFRATLGINARQRVLEQFSVAPITELNEAFYTSCLS